MVNDKYVVKYLDPRTGKYEYATIKDVGDLQKLNTKVKTSIVDAINSISTDGIDGIDGLRNDLDTIGKTIKSLEDGTLELGDFKSIDDVVSREIEDAINNLKDENSGLLKLTQEEIDKIVSDAESEYRDSIAASVRELETSKSDLEDAREKMTSIGQMLENADINYSSLTQVVDDINLYIEDVIEKTDFDMVNGIVSDYKTAVTQSKDGWGVDASKNMLSYLTGRVKNNETSLDVQHGLIQAKVGKDEFQYMTVDNLPAGKENMLHNTSDLRDWNFSSAFIFKSADDYRFTSIVQSDSAGEHIIGTTDELEQGVTYAISAYVNVQNKNKEPNEEKYAPTDGDYTATVIIDGDTIELNNVVEDNSALDGWKRVSGTFIAKRTAKQDIKFYVTSFNRDTQVGYLSAPKLEKGSSATSWIPHIEDNVSTILSQNAVMRVLSDRITSSVEEVRETKGAFETATSTFDQMADGFELNTNKLSEVLDKYGEVTGVQTQQASELKVLNESITSKVWKQDINTTLDTINIDTSNRIVNSAFNIYSYDEQTGELQLDYWDSNTGFEIKKHSQSLDNYLYAKRSNATSVNPISIKSSPFALRDGEKILFNFEYLAVGNPLDNDNVITLEMYDNDDVRVGLQEFKLSELKKEFLTAYDVGDSYKYNGSYIVKNSSVVKGTITLKLPKNGELWLTKVMLQNAGIGTIGWTPSSIDNQIIQSKLSTEINQLADSIELVAKDERLDAISGLLVKKDGKITISPEAIVSRVTSQELGDKGLVTQTSIKQTEESLRFDLVDKDGIIQTINASADGLLIDFDKVQIDGELIARMISAQSIDATQGFRLTDNNGNTLLSVVNDNGKPTLSITKDFRVKFGEIGDKLDVTIIGVVEEYYYSVDPNEPIGGRWTSTPNAFQGGNNRFIWKRNKIIYQSGKVSYYPSETGINITGSWEYEKESVTAEVVKAIDGAESAKALAVSEANQAMINANKYADEQDALIKQQVNTSVSNAISSADQAKQIATDNYNNAVAKAEELTQAQSKAFNKKFKENTSAMSTLSQATKDAEAKAQSALSKAGTNANLLTTHQNTLNTIKNTTIPNVNKVAKDAMAEAKSALSSASSAMSEAKKADGKIADYVTKNGLVNGTTVDNKINTATGAISRKITTVESKIDDLQVGGRNLVLNSSTLEASGLGAVSGTRAEYRTINTGQSYMDLEDGETITISFDIEMKIAKENPTLQVYNTNVPGRVGISSVSVSNQLQGNVGETINKRISFTTRAVLRDSPKYSYNTLEFYSNYGSNNFFKISKLKVERGNIATDWTPAPEDNLSQSEFSIFESTYKEDVKGINSTLTELSTKKVDGTTYQNFYDNEYKKTAKGVTDTYNKVNKIIDANGNSTDAFAKAVYDRNAQRQSASFNKVTKDLVKTATYTAGINGINNSIATVQGNLDNLKIGVQNLVTNSEEQTWNWANQLFTASEASKVFKPNTKYAYRWELEIISKISATNANDLDRRIGGYIVGGSNPANSEDIREWYKNSKVGDTKLIQGTFTTGSVVNTPFYAYGIRNNVTKTNSTIKVKRILVAESDVLISDWTPATEDMLGKETFTVFKNDYDETAKEVKRRLTAIDSGKEGSVIYNTNEALSTAKGNKQTITTLNTKVDGLKIGGQNLISGTDDLTGMFGSGYGGSSIKYHKNYKVTSTEWGKDTNATRVVITKASGTSGVFTTTNDFKMIFGKPYTLSFYIKNLGQNRIQFNLNGLMLNPNGTGSQSIFVNGGESGKFSATGYMRNNPEWNWFQILPVPASGVTSMDFAIAYLQVEEGNFATDWSPTVSDQLGKAEFTLFKNDYDKTAKGILSRLTAIDSSKEGSVVTRLNKTESTASGNSQTIATINKNYVKQSNINASILADKKIKDTRNTNELPPYYYSKYSQQEVREFKLTSVMGIGSSTYGILTTNVPWSDSSGGRVQQTFDTETEKFTRQGSAGWSAWVKQIDTADKTYQKITQTSSLYERVIGSSSEASVKQNMARIVMTDSSFQTEIVDKQDLRTAMASGTGMTSDPYFAKGANGIGAYDNRKTNTITVKRTKIPSTTSIPAPKGNDGYRLDIRHEASSATSPNRGGVARNTMSWANGTVVIKFVALLPTGRSFSYNNNGLGTGYTAGWLTDNKGTGKWETYMYYYRFGSSGTFSSFGHLSVTGASTAFSWYLSEYDIINVNETSASKITQLSDNINLKVSKGDISNQININTQGVVIGGNKISLSGQTSVNGDFWAKQVNAVKVKADKIEGTTAQFNSLRSNVLTANSITSTMINANTAMFDKLFSTTSATTRLVAQGAWITNANIVSLNASKITAGTIATARLDSKKIVAAGLSANVIKSTHIESSNGLIDKIFANDAYIKRMTGKKAFISSIQAIDISADKITAGIASKTGNRVTITGTGMKVSDTKFETEFINGGPLFFTKNSSGRTFIGEIGDMTSVVGGAKALGIKGAYGTPIILGVQMSKTDTAYKGKLAVHAGGVITYDTLNVEGDILFTQNGKQALRNIINVDKIFLQGTSYITSTTIVGANGSTMKDTSGWINLQAQWGVNLWYQNQKKARMYGNKFQFWCNIEPQSGFSVSGSSDVRLKHNIVDVKESSLEKLEKIKFKNFTWNSNNKDDFGFIAQEVINIIPEIIEESDDGYYRYNSTRFNMIVAHATKELNDKVKFLENKIERLERIIDGN